MTKYFLLLLVAVLLMKLINAQDSLRYDTSQLLTQVTVVYQANKITPTPFQNIIAQDLKAKAIGQEPSFLFSETPSITNYSDAGHAYGYSYFRLRGIDQTRINITLDGVPLNEPEDQGAYFSNYPDILNSLSKIQIQRGVGTSKNGVASYGGSVQLFSPNLYDSTITTFGFGYGSFNSLRAFAEYNSGIKKRKAIYVRTSEVFSDGYKYNSSNHSQSAFISGGLFYDKTVWKLNLIVGHQQNQLAWVGVPDSLIRINRRINGNENENDQFTQSLVHLHNTWRLNNFSSFQSGIYHTFLKGNYDFNLNNFLGLPTTNELYNYAFQSNLMGFFSNYILSGRHLNWITGIHGNIYDRRHIGSEKTIGPLYKNRGYKNEGSVFTKADYTLKKFTFSADIQYRYASFNYAGAVAIEKMTWHFINPKVGLSIAATPNTIVYYSVGRTGREPTRNDMFGGSDDLLSDSTGKPILYIKTPEHVEDHELGFRHQSHNLTFNLNFYYLDFKNEITLDGKFGPNGLPLTNKVEKSFRTGIELNASYKLSKNFFLSNSSSVNRSRITEQKIIFTPILTPSVIINQEAVYACRTFSIAVSARYQSKSFIEFSNSSVIKGYFLLNARAEYNIKKFQFCAFLNNLTNSKYFNNGYIDFDGIKKYFVQAPINFYTSLKYSL
jgi:iron complex outermembrane recepter protein